MSTFEKGPSEYKFNVDGGQNWQNPSSASGWTINIGRTGAGQQFRGYLKFDLSQLTSAMVLNSATLTFFRSDNYSSKAWNIGLRHDVPGYTFSASDFDVTLASPKSTTKGSNSISISANDLNGFRGDSSVYVCFCHGGAAYDNTYGELAYQSNQPKLTVDYTYGTSTMTASGSTIGSAMTFAINRQSSDFTHTITYAAGGQSGTVVTKTSNTSVQWTPPLALCSVSPSGTSVSCTFTLTTFSGNTSVGTSTLTVSLSIPDSVVPTIASDAVTLSPVSDNATVAGWGVYLAQYSKVRAVWNTSKVSGAYGSTISSYKARINYTDYTGTTATSAVINSAGTYAVQLTVTDSRGRTATRTESVTFLAYTAPYISSYQCYRCDTSGTAQDGGPSVNIKATIVITSVGNHNSGSIASAYKAVTSVSYTSMADVTSTLSRRDISMASGSTYLIRMVPSDSLGSGAEVVVTLQPKSEDILVQHTSSGIWLGIGKAPERKGVDIHGPVYSDDNYNLKDGADLIAYDSSDRVRARIYGEDGTVYLRDASNNIRSILSGSGGLSLRDSSGNEHFYIDGNGGWFRAYDSSGRERTRIAAGSGNIQAYMSSGQEAIGLYPAESQMSLYNSSGTRTVQIRGDGTASSNPLPVNQGGTHASSLSDQYKLVQGRYPSSGNTTFAVGSKYDISIQAPSGYLILAEQPLKTSGFVGAFETPSSHFLESGTQTYSMWCAIGGTGYITLPIICVKQ